MAEAQANNLPKFAQDPRSIDAVVTAAVGSLTTDAPTGTVLLGTASARGAILTKLSAMPRGTCTASSLLLFVSRDNGTTQRLKDSETMIAQTVQTTVGISETPFVNISEATPIRLGPNERLYVGSQVALAAGIVFSGELTDF